MGVGLDFNKGAIMSKQKKTTTLQHIYSRYGTHVGIDRRICIKTYNPKLLIDFCIIVYKEMGTNIFGWEGIWPLPGKKKYGKSTLLRT